MIIFTVLLKDTGKVIDLPESIALSDEREYKILGAHVQYCECKNKCAHVRNAHRVCCRCMCEVRGAR